MGGSNPHVIERQHSHSRSVGHSGGDGGRVPGIADGRALANRRIQLKDDGVIGGRAIDDHPGAPVDRKVRLRPCTPRRGIGSVAHDQRNLGMRGVIKARVKNIRGLDVGRGPP